MALKRVLITGASGLLGRAVFQEFSAAPSWEVLGLAFSRSGDKLRKVDLTDPSAIQQVVQEFKPSCVIHAAAERRPDVVESQPEATQKINIDATRTLCTEAGKVGAWVLFVSTDYVFDGSKPPYTVTDQPSPLNMYGQSKYEGEKVTLETNKGNGVLRVPILYGEVEYLGESAVTVLFEKVKDTTKSCVMSDYERRYPTACRDVAVTIRQLADKKLQDNSISGTFHWSGDENMTKYDMAVAMAEIFSLPASHIEADKKPSRGATRPFNSHLDCSRLEALGCGQRTKFREGIAHVLQNYKP
ncbi:methionine adenosyltransferase 2 subunit beta-like [Haliotis cracherodii]|uniref:methionine adenosyltransferase 2 subunit beta-like n=1 Tax=Haliotis cracherodii TaxID=6455 RepID=UPI0039ED2CE6